jgi:GTP-binding protein
VVRVDVDRSYVVADIPGLVEGAADGVGLGHQFLRHIERTALFLYLVTQDLEPGREPVGDYRALRRELAKYDPSLLDRPGFVILSQCDRPDVAEQFERVKAELGGETRVVAISAVTGQGLDALNKVVADALHAAGRWGGGAGE